MILYCFPVLLESNGLHIIANLFKEEPTYFIFREIDYYDEDYS